MSSDETCDLCDDDIGDVTLLDDAAHYDKYRDIWVCAECCDDCLNQLRASRLRHPSSINRKKAVNA